MTMPKCGCKTICFHKQYPGLLPHRDCKLQAETVVSAERPCLIAVTVVPLDWDGDANTTQTVTVTGRGSVEINEGQLTVAWFDNKQGYTFTISGNPEVLGP
jgi:hypothetical protein